MTDDEVAEWLGVAARTLADYPLHDVAHGCGLARRQCSHHSQIVAVVAKHCEAVKVTPPINWQEPLRALPPPRLEQADVDRIVAERGREMSVMLDKGLIRKTEDGRFVPT